MTKGISELDGLSTDELKELVLQLQNTQKELTRSLERYSVLYHSAPVGYLTLDREGTVLEANLTAAKMLGIPREALLECNFSSFIRESSREVLEVHREAVFSGEMRQHSELEMQRPDGDLVFVQAQCLAFPDENGILKRCRVALIDVTEKKNSEFWRIEAKQLRRMVENLPAGAVFVDHQRLTINKAAEEITGYSPDELKTVDEWFERLHHVKEHRGIYERLRAGYFQEISPPVEIVRKDGQERMVKFACHRFDDYEIWLIYDLTEAFQAERELRRSQFALKHIEESVVWVGQDGGQILFANDAGCKMFGYDHETFLTIGVPDLDVDISLEQWPDWWKRIKNDDYAVIERELITRDGETFFAEVFPCYLDFGGEEFICVIVRDMTERRAAEQALIDSDELLRAILNSATDGIITIDSEGGIQMTNPSVSKMTGYSEDELVGQHVSMLLSPHYIEENHAYLSRFLKTRADHFFGRREVLAQHKDGSTFPVDVVVSPVEGLNQLTAVIRDITERKKLESEVLNAVEQEIRRISAELHDGMGSELTGIKMRVTLLLNKLRAEDYHGIEDLETISNKLGAAIRQSRQLAKGLQPVDSEPRALVPALSALVEQLRVAGTGPGDCRFNAPAKPVSISNPSVANQLYRIAQEATHNAVKHSEATQLTVELSLIDDRLVLEVLDNGVGFNLEGPKADGLGLHIMNYRARMAGGSLTILPRKNGGTEVRCIVPIV